MRVMQGQLDDGVLANLLQYLSLNQAGGRLFLRHLQGMQGEVFFERGQVVHVVAHPLTGVEALSRLLGWHDGQFQFQVGVEASERSVSGQVGSLLLEASYRADHAVQPQEPLDEGAILVPRSPDLYTEREALTLKAIQLLRNLDGVQSLGDIALSSGRPIAELMAAAEELRSQGLAELAVVPLASRDFLTDLTRLMVDLMGPMGEIVVEDALYDLGLKPEALPRMVVGDLVLELVAQLKRRDWQHRFLAQADLVQRQHGLKGQGSGRE